MYVCHDATMTNFPPGRWRGEWIWADRSTDWTPTVADPAASDRRTAAFRRVVDLADVPDHVPARLAAVGRATWWVNGVEVGRGPVRTNPRRSVWDDSDIAPFLIAGRNVITVMVTVDGESSAWFMAPPRASDLARGALAFEAHLGDARIGSDEWLVSDDRWTSTILSGWGGTRSSDLVHRGGELLDASSLPASWASPTDDDAVVSWPAARRLRPRVFGDSGRTVPPTHPVGPFGGRPISRPVPVDIDLQPSSSGFVTDRVVVGTLRVDVEGPVGSAVVIRAAERLDVDGEPDSADYDPSLIVTLDGSRRTIESVDLYGLTGCVVVADESATVHGVSVRERLHPVIGGARFSCSDPLLDEVWRVGRRTVSICSLDAYVDCPTREQRAWTGDSVVHQMVDLTTNDDWSLARWHPLLAASPRADGMLPMAVAGDVEASDMTIIPDWALHWVHSVWNLHRYVGDRDEVARLMPVAEGVLRWFLPFCDESGVPIDVPGWLIIDWSAVYSDGASSALAGLWGRSLLDFAEMADWLGDGGRAAWARSTHERLRAGFEQLWDPERGRYVDSAVGGVRRPMASQHGQAAAIVGGLVPTERLARLVAVLTDEAHLVHAAFSRTDGPSDPGSETELGGSYLFTGHPEPWWNTDRLVVRAQPFFRYVVHDALVAAGRGDLIVSQLRDWQWLLDRCRTSWSETWYGGTTSHGWSSTPTRDLVQYVAGVRPDAPGFARAHIEPNLGDLDRVEVVTPTPYGQIRIEVDAGAVAVVTPVPARIVIDGRESRVPPGRHRVTRAG